MQKIPLPRRERGYAGVIFSVLVPPDSTAQDMRTISRALVETAKQGRPFIRAYVLFYDYPEYLKWASATLGYVRYGSKIGTPGRSVAPGEYAAMSYGDYFPVKDAASRPSPSDVRIWDEWYRRLPRQASESDERRVARWVGARHGLTGAQVMVAVSRCDKWSLPPMGVLE